MNGVWIGMTPTIVNSRQRIIQLDLCLACSECCEEVRGATVQDTLGVPIGPRLNQTRPMQPADFVV